MNQQESIQAILTDLRTLHGAHYAEVVALLAGARSLVAMIRLTDGVSDAKRAALLETATRLGASFGTLSARHAGFDPEEMMRDAEKLIMAGLPVTNSTQ